MQQDPTAVVGRRVAAAVIDGVLHFAADAILFWLLAERVHEADSLGWQVRGSQAALFYLVVLGLVGLHYGWLQGTRGYTLGKRVMHVRVIGLNGQPPGVLRALLRTIMWVVDASPWCVAGLLGLILILTTSGHRRLGDMAADSYVVAEEFVLVPQS